MESGMDVLDRAGGEAGVELLAVEAAYVSRGETLEFRPSERGGDVKSGDLFVAGEGATPYGVEHGVREPARHVLLNLQVIRVEDEAAVLVRYRLGELLGNLAPRLAVEGLALRARGRLHRVAGHVEPVLAPGDAPLSVSTLAHL